MKDKKAKIVTCSFSAKGGLTRHLTEASMILGDSVFVGLKKGLIDIGLKEVGEQKPEMVVFGGDWILDCKTFINVNHLLIVK